MKIGKMAGKSAWTQGGGFAMNHRHESGMKACNYNMAWLQRYSRALRVVLILDMGTTQWG
jgi:hypothetical protein